MLLMVAAAVACGAARGATRHVLIEAGVHRSMRKFMPISSPTRPAEATDDHRRIGTAGVIAFYLTSVLGPGILIVPAITYDTAGPASIVAWALLLLVSWPFASTFAAMAIAHPEQSGVAGFVGGVWGKAAGQAALLILCVIMGVGNPIFGVAAARYLDHVVPLGSEARVLAVGYLILLVSVGFNLLDVRAGAWLQTGLIGVLLLVLVGASLVAFRHFRPDALTPFFPHGLAGVGLAMTIGFYSFTGWENVNAIASDVRRPDRAFSRAIPVTLLIVGGIYLLVVFAYTGVVGAGRSGTVLATLLAASESPIALVGGNLMAIFLIVSAANSWVLGATRLFCALGEQGLAPAVLARRNARGAPVPALLVLTACYGVTVAAMVLFGLKEGDLIVFADAGFYVIYLLGFSAAWRKFGGAARRQAAFSLLVVLALVAGALLPALHKVAG